MVDTRSGASRGARELGEGSSDPVMARLDEISRVLQGLAQTMTQVAEGMTTIMTELF